MNRLFLIGNGLDLAHGLKTQYNDFIVWYLKRAYSEAFENGSYEDLLLTLTKTGHDIRVGDITSVDAFIDYYYCNGFNTFLNHSTLKVPNYLNIYNNPFKTKI